MEITQLTAWAVAVGVEMGAREEARAKSCIPRASFVRDLSLSLRFLHASSFRRRPEIWSLLFLPLSDSQLIHSIRKLGLNIEVRMSLRVQTPRQTPRSERDLSHEITRSTCADVPRRSCIHVAHHALLYFDLASLTAYQSRRGLEGVFRSFSPFYARVSGA